MSQEEDYENNSYRRRSHEEYQSIENFKTHEFTECIAFELAVRSAKDTIIELIKLQTGEAKNLERVRELEKVLLEDYWLHHRYFYPAPVFNHCNPYVLNLPTKDMLVKKTREYLLRCENATRIYTGKKLLDDSNFATTDEQIKNNVLQGDVDSLYYAYYYSFFVEEFPYEYKIEFNIQGDESQYLGTARFGISSSYKGEVFKLESYTNTRDQSENILTKQKSRPSLIIPQEHNSNLQVEINPNLPPKENIDFLEKALQHIHKSRSNKSTNEFRKSQYWTNEDLTLETYTRNNNTSKGKRLADMFLIYDYVEHIKNQSLECNKRIDEELSYAMLDKYDKEKNLKDKSEFTTAKPIIHSEEYGNPLSEELSMLSKKTIEDYYNTIHRWIKNKSYKNLI